MKKYLILIALMLTTSISVLAQTVVATLNHDGTYRAFYGGNAFRDAHAAAVDGDVITLSSGNFSATNITKAITVRGAGMISDTTNNTPPTIIQGDVKFNVPDTTHRLILEGLQFNGYTDVYMNDLYNPLFQKCKFYFFGGTSSCISPIKNGLFVNCIVTGVSVRSNSSVAFINSFVCLNYHSGAYSNVVYDLQNCVIRAAGSSNSLRALGNITNSSFANSVIIGVGDYVSGLPSSNTCMNCVATKAVFSTGGNNKVVVDVTTLMKEYTGTNYYDGISFELTDEAAATYLGTDGTQVGMYGGLLPFNPTPSSLQITRCNVAQKSTADGKLSVDIEVRTVE